MNAPIFFRKFPSMFDFLLSQLQLVGCVRNGVSKDTYDFTFHLLLILSSLTPSGRLEDNHFKVMLSDDKKNYLKNGQ